MRPKKTKTDRIDDIYIPGGHIANESCKLPGHEARMKAHEQRVHQEYFLKAGEIEQQYLKYDGPLYTTCRENAR